MENQAQKYNLVQMALLLDYYDGIKNGYYASNYKNSNVRTWLNGEFYNSAFLLGDSYIQTAEVDNSAASTTNDSPNEYACENTYDKVYLLSYQDYKNSSYFADVAARQCKMTDYARANGCYSDTSSSYKNNGCCWTRSPNLNHSHHASRVLKDGNIINDSVHYTYNGVRPAITVKFE